MPASVAKTVTALVALITSVVPHTICQQLGVAMFFVVVDTITGLIVARYLHKIASKTMREKLVSKLASYSILTAVGVGAAILASSWLFVSAALLAIIAIETVSLLENLALWSKFGGLNLGPAQPFLTMVSRYFSVMEVPPTPPITPKETPDAQIPLPPSAPASE